jgi:hypothetical protein
MTAGVGVYPESPSTLAATKTGDATSGSLLSPVPDRIGEESDLQKAIARVICVGQKASKYSVINKLLLSRS